MHRDHAPLIEPGNICHFACVRCDAMTVGESQFIRMTQEGKKNANDFLGALPCLAGLRHCRRGRASSCSSWTHELQAFSSQITSLLSHGVCPALSGAAARLFRSRLCPISMNLRVLDGCSEAHRHARGNDTPVLREPASDRCVRDRQRTAQCRIVASSPTRWEDHALNVIPWPKLQRVDPLPACGPHPCLAPLPCPPTLLRCFRLPLLPLLIATSTEVRDRAGASQGYTLGHIVFKY